MPAFFSRIFCGASAFVCRVIRQQKSNCMLKKLITLKSGPVVSQLRNEEDL